MSALLEIQDLSVSYGAIKALSGVNISVPAAVRVKVSPRSRKMVDQLRGKQFTRIFLLLDSDNDGSISKGAVELGRNKLKILNLNME